MWTDDEALTGSYQLDLTVSLEEFGILKTYPINVEIKDCIVKSTTGIVDDKTYLIGSGIVRTYIDTI